MHPLCTQNSLIFKTLLILCIGTSIKKTTLLRKIINQPLYNYY